MKEKIEFLKAITVIIITTLLLFLAIIWSSLFVSKILYPWKTWNVYEDIGTYNNGFIVSVKTGYVWKYDGDFDNGNIVTMTITDMATSNIEDDNILHVKEGVDMYE